MVLDVRRSRELQATVLALRSAERSIRLDLNKRSRSAINPLWRAAVNARATTTLERRVIASGVRATASDRGVSLLAATSGRPLSGGLVPSYQWFAAEMGMNITRVTARRGSTTYPLWVGAQWEQRSSHGQVGFAAASEVGTKLVALWVTTVVDGFRSIPEVEITPR